MIVVKVGGSIVERADPLLDELAMRRDVVLVHGFGPQSTALGEARGITPQFITSPQGVRSRFTDDATMHVLGDAAREVGRSLTLALDARGAEVAWFTPGDQLFEARVKPALRSVTEDGKVLLLRGNRSGKVTRVDAGPVQAALAAGHLPVVTPIAHDETGPVSVDGDRAAAALAGALGADALVLLTDVPGYLADHPDPSSRVARLEAGSVDDLVGNGASAGMVRKLVACRETLEAGVPRALVGSALRERPLTAALEGDATEVVR